MLYICNKDYVKNNTNIGIQFGLCSLGPITAIWHYKGCN